MKNTSYAILAVLFVVLTFTPNILAQDSPQWHLPDGVKARYGKGTIYDIKYSPDGAKMAVATGIGIWIYDTETADELNLLTGHAKVVSSIAFSPDSTILASGSYDKTVRLWNVESGREIHRLTAHTKAVKTVAFSSDGTTLASGSYDKTVRLWDVATGIERHTLEGHTRSVYDVAFNHDGTMLASVGVFDSISIRLWEVANGTEIRTITTGKNGAFSVAFSPVTNTLASGGHDKTVRLWDADTGTELHTLKGHTHHVSHVVFSPDGDVLASATGSHWDTTIRLWDVQSWMEIQTLTADTHSTHSVHSVAFSPDGNTLASGGYDGTIRLWDIASDMTYRTFKGHTSSVSTIKFSSDRQMLVSRSSDGTVLVWDLTPVEPINTIVSLSPVSVQSPAIGESLVFMLNIAEGQNVAGYQATVSFDNTALRYVESENGDYLPASAFSIPTVVNDNSVTFATTTFADESNGDGMLATITFEVVAIKASTVCLSNVILTNNLGESAKPIIADAEIIQPQQRDEDVNEDGAVDITDLTLVASNFGKTGENAADVNDDGIVNIVDLTLVAAAIGTANAVAPALWNVNSGDMLSRATVTAWLQEARQLNSAGPTFQRGVLVLENLLKALTPKDTALLPNYPNPFNPETWIPYQLAEPAEVSISVYAADGKLVRTLDLGHQPIGIYHQRNRAAHWNGCNEFGEPVASGVYFYTLKAGEFSATRKMLIKK